MRAALLAVLALGTCGPSPAGPPAPPPASNQPESAVRAPLEAMPSDAEVGLARTSREDHLPMELAARDEPDPVLGLAAFQSAGWADAARSGWAGSGHRLNALVVQADRSGGAARLQDYFGAQASRAPFAAGGCGAAAADLDACALGTTSARALAVGRLGRDAFRLDGDPATVARVLALLPAKLRPG